MGSLSITRRKPLLITVVTGLLVAGTCPLWMQGAPLPTAASAASTPKGQAGVSSPRTGPHILSSGIPRQQISAEEMEWMAGIRQAGVHGDRSRIAEMLSAIQPSQPYNITQSPDPYMRMVPRSFSVMKIALNALAHLGAVDALPAIDALIQNERTDPELRKYAIAARGRLIAESSANSLTDPTLREGAMISRFLKESGITADRLNTAAKHFRAAGGKSRSSNQPLEVYIMRQLADIAYREHHTSSSRIPGAEGIDFSQDPASALKILLAPMAQYGRAAWLVQDLSHATGPTDVTGFEEELAADEGLPASRAASLLLQDMLKHRDQYPVYGIGNLSDLLSYIGDKSQLPLLEQLMKSEPTPNLQRGWYIAYGCTLAGKREFLEDGY